MFLLHLIFWFLGLVQNRFGGINQSDKVYNLGGELLESRSIYRKPNKADLVVKNAYERDIAGRVTKVTHHINAQSSVLATYHYDEVGRLVQKKILPQGFAFPAYITRQASVANGTADIASQVVTLLPGFVMSGSQRYAACIANGIVMGPIQTIDYQWHIRGGLKGINASPLTSGGVPSSGGTENDLFSLKLEYEDDGRFYNGLISKQSWLTATPPLGAGGLGLRSYLYDYDNVNRFKSAAYTGIGNENYSVNNVNYDQNGNIQTLQRSGYTGSPSGGGGGWALIDNLTYNYGTNHNQLVSITDASDATKGYKTPPLGAGGLGLFTYYADGSTKSDANKGITNIVYNYLGLQDRIEFNTGAYIQNIYDAEGTKLRQIIVPPSGGQGATTDYMGEVIYRNDTLISVAHDEGYSVPLDDNNTAFMPRFFYNDHLGNTRLVYSVAPNGAYITQENHYGPYGEVLEGIGSQATESSGRWKFLFQGKEYVDAFGLNMYDFGWRMGDSWAGRWPSLDPADQFQSMTGYGYMANNSVSLTDPDGRFVPLVYGGAALIGGGFNLYSNWRKVKNLKQGLAYFASGAVGGMVSVTNPVAGGLITSGGNVAIDVATGNVPDFKNSKTPIKDGLFYAGGVALDGLGAGGAGALSKFALKSLGVSIETMVHVAGASSPMVNTVAGEVVVEGAEWVVTGVKTPVAEMSTNLLNTARGNLLNSVTNPKLKSIIDFTYRQGARIGSGSTGEAIRYELQGGNLVNSSNHLQKAKEILNSYRDLLKGNFGQLGNADRNIIFEQIKDLTRGTGLNWQGVNFDYLKNISR